MPEEGSKEVTRVQVVCRVRPVLASESSNELSVSVAKDGGSLQVQLPDRELKDALPGTSKLGARSYSFDACLPGRTTQAELCEVCGLEELVQQALDGYSITIFAFGQTGSGKTHTVIGPRLSRGLADTTDAHPQTSIVSDPEDGLLPRALQSAYSAIHERVETSDIKVKLTCVELYNEAVTDLLAPGNKCKPLQLRKEERGGFKVDGLQEVSCPTAHTALKHCAKALTHRQTRAHALNEYSSRSHCMITLTFHSQERTSGDQQDRSTLNSRDRTLDEADQASHRSHSHGGASAASQSRRGLKKHGKLVLVDLAGSERLKDSGSSGKDAVRETGSINKSLFTLGQVLAGLASRKPSSTPAFIPYRDSKLTMMLWDGLRGAGRVLMLACVAPLSSHAMETLNTLHFATMALRIKSHPVVILDPQDALVLDLRNTIRKLQAENKQLASAMSLLTSGAPPENVLASLPESLRLQAVRDGLGSAPPLSQSPTGSEQHGHTRFARLDRHGVAGSMEQPLVSRSVTGAGALRASNAGDSRPGAGRDQQQGSKQRPDVLQISHNQNPWRDTSPDRVQPQGWNASTQLPAVSSHASVSMSYSQEQISPMKSRNKAADISPLPPSHSMYGPTSSATLQAVKSDLLSVQKSHSSMQSTSLGPGGVSSYVSAAGGNTKSSAIPSGSRFTPPGVISEFPELAALEAQFQQQIRQDGIVEVEEEEAGPSVSQDGVPVVKPEPKALNWAEKNTWFGSQQEMTAYAYEVHDELVNVQKMDAASDEYYTEIEKRVQAKFPEAWAAWEEQVRLAEIAAREAARKAAEEEVIRQAEEKARREAEMAARLAKKFVPAPHNFGSALRTILKEPMPWEVRPGVGAPGPVGMFQPTRGYSNLNAGTVTPPTGNAQGVCNNSGSPAEQNDVSASASKVAVSATSQSVVPNSQSQSDYDRKVQQGPPVEQKSSPVKPPAATNSNKPSAAALQQSLARAMNNVGASTAMLSKVQGAPPASKSQASPSKLAVMQQQQHDAGRAGRPNQHNIVSSVVGSRKSAAQDTPSPLRRDASTLQNQRIASLSKKASEDDVKSMQPSPLRKPVAAPSSWQAFDTFTPDMTWQQMQVQYLQQRQMVLEELRVAKQEAEMERKKILSKIGRTLNNSRWRS